VTIELDEDRLRTGVRATARVAKALELALAELGTSLPQYRLLAYLSGGPERATALAGMLEVSPPTLTALVDGTVQKGLVERTTAEEDRRCVRHVLTAEGQRVLDAADGALVDRLVALLAPLADEDRAKAVDGLEVLAKAMEAHRHARVGAK
jgi:DNA-binding MarR family transcriptional regulator